MGWCRSRARIGAWLALTALALNLALAFGHHHFGEMAAHGHPAIERAGATAPTGHDDDDHRDPEGAHPCLACIVVTAAAVAATAPALPVPAATRTATIASAMPVAP